MKTPISATMTLSKLGVIHVERVTYNVSYDVDLVGQTLEVAETVSWRRLEC
jgi:hypothetical protein